jgi:hypothetical protein
VSACVRMCGVFLTVRSDESSFRSNGSVFLSASSFSGKLMPAPASPAQSLLISGPAGAMINIISLTTLIVRQIKVKVTLRSTISRSVASKQAVAYCWHSPAWLFLVPGPIGTHDHIFVLIYNPYRIRRWASSSVRGGVGLFNAVIYFIRC